MWARGYFVAGSENVTDVIIQRYIQNQDLEERRKSDNFEIGLSFKAGIDDLRNSPIADVAETLYGKAIGSGWVTTVGENINELEKTVAER